MYQIKPDQSPKINPSYSRSPREVKLGKDNYDTPQIKNIIAKFRQNNLLSPMDITSCRKKLLKEGLSILG